MTASQAATTPEVSVILPCFNERDHVELEVKRIRAALTVVGGRIDAAEAHRLAVLDETFQEEFWGTDAEAAARRERIAREVALAGRLLALSRA